MTKHGLSLEERFWLKVDKREEDECWEWKGALSNGYGQIRDDDKMINAHRYSYELAYGKVPDEIDICPCQKTKSCPNPRHLLALTRKENANTGNIPHGEERPNSKLTDEKVREIRKLIDDGVSIGAIAEKFSVTYSIIYRLKTGKTWRHIDPKLKEKL